MRDYIRKLMFRLGIAWMLYAVLMLIVSVVL
jgi:hypothetical protein